VTVVVAADGGGARVEVTERSGDSTPVLLPAASADDDAEDSRGIRLVDALAARHDAEVRTRDCFVHHVSRQISFMHD
jgi:hypothetical protein